ncbi:MAG: DUF4270 family protein [Saprospiraceae bacterium]
MKSSLLAFPMLLYISIVIILTPACSDPTLVGKDLLEEDQVNVKVTDTITLRTYTETYDSILTYSPFETSQLDDYLIGNLIDPIFGKTTSTLYAQLLLEDDQLDLSNATLDSVVLVLPIDSVAVYGQQPQEYGFEVYRITEDIDNDNSFFSNESFVTGATAIGSFTGSLDPFVDRPVFNPRVDSIQQLRQVRIRMNDDFAQELFSQDSSTFRSNNAFIDYLQGIQVISTTENTGILGFDLNTTAGMQLYFTTDTLKQFFNFNFQVDGVRALNFQHDYSSSVVEELIEKQELGDSLFLLQGAGGLRGIIEIPYITELQNAIINRAEIQVPIQDLDAEEFASPPNVILRYFNDENELQDVDDLALSIGNTVELFGGVIVAGEGNNSDYYSFNISDHLQDMINGVVDNRLVVQIFREDERASRVLLKGAKNSEPTKLNVIFTEL